MSVNLEYLKVFCAVARNQSITVAAEQLFISQPAVSQCIRHLEDNLGAPLFVRTPRGMRLTPEAEVLYTYAAQGYEYMCTAERKFKELLALDAGEIRIGASDMTLRFFLLPYLEAFHRIYPKIKVKVTNAPTPETLRSLRQAGIDFGIVSDPIPEQSDLRVIPVCPIQDCLIVSSRFAEYQNRTIELQELAQAPLILLESGTSTRTYIDSIFQAAQIHPNVEFELATSDLIVEFAARGLGIGCVERNFALPDLTSGRVFEIKLKDPIPPRSICIATDDRLPISPAGRRLLDLVLK